MEPQNEEQIENVVGWEVIERESGYRISRHPEDMELLRERIEHTKDFLKMVNFEGEIFVFRQEEQDIEHRFEGVCLPFYKPDEPQHPANYVIGLSLEALERSQEYTDAILIHELCHWAISASGGDITSHDKEFRDECRNMLESYKTVYGVNLSERWDVTGPKMEEKRSDSIAINENVKKGIFGGIRFRSRKSKWKPKEKSYGVLG